MPFVSWVESWWSWWFLPKIVVFLIPLVVSLISLAIVLHDRQPRFLLRAKKGKWCTLFAASNHEIVFRGKIEVYNVSSRANAIREYRFYWIPSDGSPEIPLENEQYEIDQGMNQPKEVDNLTPLTLEPYSGTEVQVQAIAKVKSKPYKMKIRMEIEDLFGKTSTLEVIADYK